MDRSSTVTGTSTWDICIGASLLFLNSGISGVLGERKLYLGFGIGEDTEELVCVLTIIWKNLGTAKSRVGQKSLPGIVDQ